jgi:hypothetical protein
LLPVAAAAAAGLCIATTIPLEWGHARIKDRYVKISAPAIEPNTLVVIVGTYPISYLIPFFDPSIRWVGGVNGLINPQQNNLMARRARELIQSHKGPMMVLEAGPKKTPFDEVISSLSLVRTGDCVPMSSNLGGETYRICPTERKQL